MKKSNSNDSLVSKILADWNDDNGVNTIKLPSIFQIGDKVKIFLMPEGETSFPGFTARILAVHFTASKVKYDVEIKFAGDWSTRIYNLDSVLVSNIK